MIEMTIGCAGGWYYPLYRVVGCRRWKWPMVADRPVRFTSRGEVERFLQALSSSLGVQGRYCLLLG
jgi:hypothetical protein